MKEFKGTPGPWHWQGEVLCNDEHIVGGDSWVFRDADKRLIAAAPGLLEVLQELMRSYDDFRVRHGRIDEPKNKLMLDAQAAINKALGEKQ